jgi:membrane protease YdiL (CAAX protease family)
MKGNYKYSTGQLFNFAQESYFERTSRPIYAIVFLLPFIVFYEVGTILINTDVLNQSQVRVVAFVWLQNFLEYLGFGSKLAWMMPPLTVVIILVGLQLASHKRWSFGIGDICPMAIECVLLAVPLIVLSLFLNTSVMPEADVALYDSSVTYVQSEAVVSYSPVVARSLSVAEGAEAEAMRSGSLLANIVTGIGAGIYEELVFRLILICLLMLLFQDVLRLNRKNSIILAVLVSAAMFSVHHHIVYLDGRFGQGSPFNWMEFGFRAVAGVYFAVLFAIRGFGITAGTHAFYDIIATIINSVFFQQ